MSTLIDFARYDGAIHLEADRRRGLWATQSLIRGKRTVRNAGQLPTTASAHTLHVVALMAALRDISRAQAAELVRDADIVGLVKPRLLVICTDESFCDALQAKIQGQRSDKPLRCGKQFLIELARQLARFDVSWVTDPESNACKTLRNWASKVLLAPSLLSTIPPILLPSVVSAVIGSPVHGTK